MKQSHELKEGKEVTVVLSGGTSYTGTVEQLSTQTFVSNDGGLSGHWSKRDELLEDIT